PLVEEGWTEHAVTEQVARIYLNESFQGDFLNADVLLLGCTHYPLLKPVLSRIVPAQVKIVDSAYSTAQVVAAHVKGTLGDVSQELRLKFFATDSAEKFRKLGSRFLGRSIANVQHVDLKE